MNDIKLASSIPKNSNIQVLIKEFISDQTMNAGPLAGLFFSNEEHLKHMKAIEKIADNILIAHKSGLYERHTNHTFGPPNRELLRPRIDTFSVISWVSLHTNNRDSIARIKQPSPKIRTAITQIKEKNDYLFSLLKEMDLEYTALDLLPIFNKLLAHMYDENKYGVLYIDDSPQLENCFSNMFYFNAKRMDYGKAQEALLEFYSKVESDAYDTNASLRAGKTKTPSLRSFYIKQVTYSLLDFFGLGFKGKHMSIECIRNTHFNSLVSFMAGLLHDGIPIDSVDASSDIKRAINTWKGLKFSDHAVKTTHKRSIIEQRKEYHTRRNRRERTLTLIRKK